MIADAMGVTKTAVYHQFKSKDDVVLAVTATELEELQDDHHQFCSAALTRLDAPARLGLNGFQPMAISRPRVRPTA
jgi:AcrR family transcriptional regulator